MTVAIVFNAAAGDDPGGARAEALAALATGSGGALTLFRAEGPEALDAAVDAALAAGAATVAAAGGDGTVARVAARLIGGRTRLGVLPFGTFNFFAREHGLPEDLAAAAALLTAGRPRAVDVGDLNGRPFLNNASLGLYPALLRRRERLYRRWGRSRLAAGVATLGGLLRVDGRVNGRLVVDGASRPLRSPLVFVARNATQLRGLGLDGAQWAEAGRLVVYVAADGPPGALLTAGVGVALGLPPEEFGVAAFPARRLTVRTVRPVRQAALDGERLALAAPFRFSVRQGALTLMGPPD